MGEDEGRAGDVADLAGADGDVQQRPPAAGEQGEPAFAQAAQRPLEGVAGAGVDIEILAARRLAHRDVDADPGSVVSRVGRRLSSLRTETTNETGGNPERLAVGTDDQCFCRSDARRIGDSNS